VVLDGIGAVEELTNIDPDRAEYRVKPVRWRYETTSDSKLTREVDSSSKGELPARSSTLLRRVVCSMLVVERRELAGFDRNLQKVQ
jgi:hypothetical protein